VNGHVEVVKALLSDSRVDVNRAGPNNCTPLWMASLNGHADVVKFLLGSERKIDQTIKSVDGEDWWCGKTASEVVSALSLRGQLESETKAEFSSRVANSRAVLELFDPSKKSTKIFPPPQHHEQGTLLVRATPLLLLKCVHLIICELFPFALAFLVPVVSGKEILLQQVILIFIPGTFKGSFQERYVRVVEGFLFISKDDQVRGCLTP